MVQNMFSYVVHVADFKDFFCMIYIYICTLYIYTHLHLGSNFVVNVGKFCQFHGASYGKWGVHGSKSSGGPSWGSRNRPRHWIPCLLHQHWRLGNSPMVNPKDECWNPHFLRRQKKDGWMWLVFNFFEHFHKHWGFFISFWEFFWLGTFGIHRF